MQFIILVGTKLKRHDETRTPEIIIVTPKLAIELIRDVRKKKPSCQGSLCLNVPAQDSPSGLMTPSDQIKTVSRKT